jgi:hypothetical protein
MSLKMLKSLDNVEGFFVYYITRLNTYGDLLKTIVLPIEKRI